MLGICLASGILLCIISLLGYFYSTVRHSFIFTLLAIWILTFLVVCYFSYILKTRLGLLLEQQSTYESARKGIESSKSGCIYCKSVLNTSNLKKHRKSIRCGKAQVDFHLTPEQKSEAWSRRIKETNRKRKAKKERKRLLEEKKTKIEIKDKARKNEAFTRKNFQPGHSSITMKKKEQIWNSGQKHGSCQKCNSKRKAVSFWWVIHPELKIKLLCDSCAKSLDLPINIRDEGKKNRSISKKVRDSVWRRDGGRCVECDSNENLEYDHIIPFSKGGSNTERNIQLLCEVCNRNKSNKIGL